MLVSCINIILKASNTMTWTITFQQKPNHALRPRKALISCDTKPSQRAAVKPLHKHPWSFTALLHNTAAAAAFVHVLKVKLPASLHGMPRLVPKPGAEGHLSNFCSCPGQHQADPPAGDHVADDSSGCQQAVKRREKPARKHQGTLPDENCNLLATSGAAGIPVFWGAKIWETYLDFHFSL